MLNSYLVSEYRNGKNNRISIIIKRNNLDLSLLLVGKKKYLVESIIQTGVEPPLETDRSHHSTRFQVTKKVKDKTH